MLAMLMVAMAAMAMATGAAALAADYPSYKTVIADEFTRRFLATQYFARECGATGGVLTTPSSLAGAEVDTSFLNISGRHAGPWEEWRGGMLQVRPQATLGASWDDGPTNAGGRTRGMSFSGSFGDGFRWRPWAHTTLSLYMDVGYQYLENHYTYGDAERADAGQLDHRSRNWFAHVVTSLSEVGLAQSIPLTTAAGAWEEPENEPRSPWLRLQTRYANAMQFGFFSRNNDQARFVNTFVWTTGAEVFVPLGRVAGRAAYAAPFFEYIEFHDDGNRAVSGDGILFRAGVRAGFFRDKILRDMDGFHLTGAAYWGADLSGWQLSAGLVF